MTQSLMMSYPTGAPVGAGLTRYGFCSGLLAMTAALVETDTNIIFRATGRLSNLLVNVITNTLDDTATFRLRKNGVDGNQSLTVPAATTGEFEDTTNIDEVADGDLFSYQLVTAGTAGSIQFHVMRCFFYADIDSVTRIAVGADNGLAQLGTYPTSATTSFQVLGGIQSKSNTTEASVKCSVQRVGTFRNLAVNVGVNTRDTASTVTLRKNEADSTITVSVGATLTGFFEDVTNVETAAVDDAFDYSVITSGGSGSIYIASMQIDYVSLDETGMYITGDSVNNTSGQGSTLFIPIEGSLNLVSSSTTVRVSSGFVLATYLAMSTTVAQNNVDDTSTIVIQNTNVDGNMTVSIPANTTGTFSNVVEPGATSSYPADFINFKVVVGAGAGGDTIRINCIAVWAFIVPFKLEEHHSMSSTTPEFQQNNMEMQSGFFGSFDSPMFGD